MAKRRPAGSSAPPVPYPLAVDTLGKDEIDAAIAVLRSGRYTMGRLVAAFESQFADWVEAEAAVMVNSGSSANLLMVEAMVRGISPGAGTWEPGDEVIVPALSWPTTVWPVAQLGLTPVIVDVDPDTLAVAPDAVAAAIGPRTKAVFVTHVLGQAADVAPLTALADEHGMTILEDACESLGSALGTAHVGTLGSMGSFSMYFSHHITTIEGGMVVTNDLALADDLRSMRAHGWSRERSDEALWIERSPEIDPRFLFVTTGFNVRPTEIQAAIGSVQLERLPAMLSRRQEVAQAVQSEVVRHAPWLKVIGAQDDGSAPPHPKGWSRNSWMNIAFFVTEESPYPRSEVVERLEHAGVETRPIIAGNIARHPAMATVAHRVEGELSVADRAFDRGFMIGCSGTIDDDQLEVLLGALRGF